MDEFNLAATSEHIGCRCPTILYPAVRGVRDREEVAKQAWKRSSAVQLIAGVAGCLHVTVAYTSHVAHFENGKKICHLEFQLLFSALVRSQIQTAVCCYTDRFCSPTQIRTQSMSFRHYMASDLHDRPQVARLLFYDDWEICSS